MTCPVELALRIQPATNVVPVPVEIVIAEHEYEAWFLAAVESLRSHPAVRGDAIAPPDPEGNRASKTFLEKLMHESYKETLHQPKFSALMDLSAARSGSRSFRRMVHAIALLAGK